MIGLLNIFSNVTKGQVFQYMTMPQILPRLEEFYRSGFSRLAYMIALVYKSVNLLPNNHPIFARSNKNHLGIRTVMASAAAELKFDKKNIDKIAIYFLILAGLVILGGQFVLTIAYLMVNPALAQTMPTTYAAFFATPAYQTDVAYRLLFSVFGVPDLFNVGGARNPFHIALHALFQFYSVGLLVIAVIITCYYIFAVLAETAQTGVPFGKRYNHVWTPIRLVVALGLLIPMGYGLNAAQWVTLYAAKFGSDFATQGWVLFNNTMTGAYLNNPSDRVGRPQNPDLMPLARFMMTMSACRQAYASYYGNGAAKIDIRGYLVKSSAASPTSRYYIAGSPHSDFQAAWNYFNKGDIIIRFGHYDPTRYAKELGGVHPYCGEIKLQSGDISEPGAIDMQESYYDLITFMDLGNWGLRITGENLALKYIPVSLGGNPSIPPPNPTYKATLSGNIDKYITGKITNAVNLQAGSTTWNKNLAAISQLGWGGAGMWYNTIAQINGSLVTATNNIPVVTTQASPLDYMRKEQSQNNQNPSNPNGGGQSGNANMNNDDTIQGNIGDVLSKVDGFWTNEDIDQGTFSGKTKTTSNLFIDMVNLVFGTRGLFDMCANANVHPLAQLSILGKGLVEASIRNLGLAIGFGAIGVLPVAFLGAASGVAAKILTSVASITLTMGFMLFYVLPFMPFLYFFFAVGSWIKGLFEAMIGVPLWALAHLRIDGEGLPGDAAMDGYYLIFEIFLRPILIVFGLLASVVIFGSMVKVLNEIYSLVVTNLAGHDETFTQLCGVAGTGAGGSTSAVAFFRGPVDELFYTILYAIIVYMIGMSCFKLIDLIPNNILRYMGSRASTYGDTAQDPAEGLMFKLSIGSQSVSGQLINIGQQGGQAFGSTIKAFTEMAAPPNKTPPAG